MMEPKAAGTATKEGIRRVRRYWGPIEYNYNA